MDLPHGIWRTVGELPDIHRDLIDRMLSAHALASGLTIATADASIHRYSVPFVLPEPRPRATVSLLVAPQGLLAPKESMP
ncbi:hypothetical protein [Novosphingobium sp. Gsoil 351]|uniref:hypothetical protein n=1 Tax=Novosphingobium sp. Gsoil 351 TaxID=2675225 RepID=UPI0018A87BA1